MSSVEIPAAVTSISGAATTLVYVVLALDGPLRSGEVIERTGVSENSVYRALRELQDVGLVETRPCFEDARSSVYAVADGGDSENW